MESIISLNLQIYILSLKKKYLYILPLGLKVAKIAGKNMVMAHEGKKSMYIKKSIIVHF